MLWLPEGHGSYEALKLRQRKVSVIQFIPNNAPVSQQFTGLIESRPPPPPTLPARPYPGTHLRTLFLPALGTVVRCALFFQSGQRGIWAGVQADYQQHIARAEDKKQHIQSIFTPPLSFLPAAFHHPVFTHSFHFNACAPWFISIFHLSVASVHVVSL